MPLSTSDGIFLSLIVIFCVTGWALRYKLTDLNDARSGVLDRSKESRRRLAFYGSLIATIWMSIIFVLALRQMLHTAE